MWRALTQRWMRWWFEPTTPDNLGLCRLIIVGILFLYYLPLDATGWARVPSVFRMPIPAFRLLHLEVLPANALAVLQVIWKVALLLTAVGLWTRASATVSAALGLYLLGLPNNFGKTHHFDGMVVIALTIFAVARCADAWSLDALRRADPARPGERLRSGEYTWPIRAMWASMSLIFFAAGVAKLRYSGLSWITSNNMAILLVQAQYHIANADPAVRWGLAIATSPWICRMIAAATMVFETGYPLALFIPAARWIIVPGMAGLLIGIRLLMGPTFWPFVICQLFWVPWDRVAAWLRARLPAGKRVAVVFDGACGLCQRTIAVLRRLDVLGRVEWLDAVHQWREVAARFPQLDQGACLADMHGVSADGAITRGFDTYRMLAWVLPLGWVLLPMLYLPGVRPIGRRVYGAIAGQRLRQGCSIARSPS